MKKQNQGAVNREKFFTPREIADIANNLHIASSRTAAADAIPASRTRKLTAYGDALIEGLLGHVEAGELTAYELMLVVIALAKFMVLHVYQDELPSHYVKG